MRFRSRLWIVALLACVLVALAGCPSQPKPAEKVIGINNSDVFRMAQEALQPIADQSVNRGDRLLLVNMKSFYGSGAWRFPPAPAEIAQDVFEGTVVPGVNKAFKAGDELKQLKLSYKLDSTKKVYRLKASGDDYNEILLGRALAGAGWSGVVPFSIDAFARLNPYFVDSFEGGLLAAVLKKQARGFERLETVGMTRQDQESLVASVRKYYEDHGTGKLVFDTNMITFPTWADIQARYKPNTINKILMYSVDNVVAKDMEYIGFQASFKLIDVLNGGRLLWTGTKTMTSAKFPKDKVPAIGALRLTLPPQVASTQRDAIAKTLRDAGVKLPMNAVLLKIDDIPIFGCYPVTREDYAVENALQGLFSSMPGINVVEKMYTRLYKQPWQMAHAVHYTNPLLGGDYNELQNYYGAQYVIGYRVLWSKVQGVQLMEGDKDLELAGKMLGIYVKVIDMTTAGHGRIVYSDFLPFVGENDLGQSNLYRCYARTKGLTGVADALRGAGVVLDSTSTALVNRRMEIANNYIGEHNASEGFILNRLPKGNDQKAVMMAYYDVYEVIRKLGKTEEKASTAKRTTSSSSSSKTAEEPKLTQDQELNLLIAVNLMQSWFEDGLTTALVAGDVSPCEKMESLYSRYLIDKYQGSADSDELYYLSPLLLSQWGTTWKAYYGIDKLIYFSLLETAAPGSQHIKTPAGSPIARFFPLVTYEPDSLQVAVVNTGNGDYEFRQDIALK
jgi:hypothetical protein